MANVPILNRHGRRVAAKEAGYKNDNPLIEEKVIPESVIELRKELAKAEHKDIYNLAIKGASFGDCLGIIAAELKIVLDGYYDISDLAGMLASALKNRKNTVLLRSAILPPVNFDVENEDWRNSVEVHPIPDAFTRMMHEAGCMQCDNKAACKNAGHCLGEDSRSEKGYFTKEQKKEFGL